MMGALDYIRWRGDLSFRTDPFNEVDNLLFSQMIYGGYEEVIGADERITIRELGERYFGQHKQKSRRTFLR